MKVRLVGIAAVILIFFRVLGGGLGLCATETEILKDKLNALAKEIEELQKKEKEKRKQIELLMKRIEQLETKQNEAKPKKVKLYWKDGFGMEYKNANCEYKLRLRPAIQVRYTFMDRDDDIEGGEENYSSFVMRRLRLFIDGTGPTPDWGYLVHIQLEPKSALNVHDAYLVWKKYNEFKIQFGRMKIPGLGVEFWQSGFKLNGTGRTIFTDDGENYWPYDGGTKKMKAGGHLLDNGFPVGGMLNYRSQGIMADGYLDLLNRKQFLCYWIGFFNGRDTQGLNDVGSSDKLYSLRIGINWLPGSDPKGPMGPTTFNNYTMQGDYGYNKIPALATVFSSFWTKDRVDTYYDNTGKERTSTHDVENYGFDSALLFRYRGFSTDLEGAWEEFIQDPGGTLKNTWDRWALRANIGYFIVPKKWEAVFKYAYFQRINNNNPLKSNESGLGLVKLSNGKFGVEDYLQQFILGLNYYLHGFNQYLSFDVSLLQRNIKDASQSEAGQVGMNANQFDSKLENDWRFRLMYQFFF